MTLTKKDKQEVAVMIARATRTIADTGWAATVTADVESSQAVEDAAQDPEVKNIGGIEEISIITRSGITAVFLQGRVDGQDPVTIVGFDFPPNDAKFLSELKRAQNDPHLFQQLLLFFKVPSAGKKTIETLYVTYNKTIEEA